MRTHPFPSAVVSTAPTSASESTLERGLKPRRIAFFLFILTDLQQNFHQYISLVHLGKDGSWITGDILFPMNNHGPTQHEGPCVIHLTGKRRGDHRCKHTPGIVYLAPYSLDPFT